MQEENTDYIILDKQGEPLRFESDNQIVIYGELEDAELDCIEGETIIPLVEYANKIGVDWKTLVSDLDDE